MLKKLHIKNYALIEELELDFSNGLTVVTGETGSGKSILLGALGLALGERATSSSVRHGATQCIIEAHFKSHQVSDLLDSWDIDSFKDNEIQIRRELTASGRSKAFINDSQTNIGTLKEVGALLVDLHGQDETRALMERSTRLELLDHFGGHFDIRDSYRAAYSAWRTSTQKLLDLEAIASKPQSDVDYLQFQFEELQELNLEETDWEGLEDEFLKLTNSTSLASGYNSVYEAIDGLGLSNISKVLDEISSFSKEASDLAARFKSSMIELEDLAHEASSLSDNVSFDPNRLQIIEDKLEGIKRAMHKHRLNSSNELIRLQSQIQLQIESAENLDKAIELAKEGVLRDKAQLFVAGEALKNEREKCGGELLNCVNGELIPLKLPDVRINWVFTEAKEPDLNGIEDVDLLFSANVGAPQYPITQIASGGEKSRVMLAFKVAISSRRSIPTIVLDEIDTGVSGDIASRMATSMKNMSSRQQVFSVTHLAQVAAAGDQHLDVVKSIDSNSTKTFAKFLEADEKTEAIAQMLSGSNVTDEARAQAVVLRNSNQ
tara:strand:+ start:344 stop:1987 length:1644 start_codon:yes stop_codon:yes gene_type:complete